jgi:hypothetical protein
MKLVDELKNVTKSMKLPADPSPLKGEKEQQKLAIAPLRTLGQSYRCSREELR